MEQTINSKQKQNMGRKCVSRSCSKKQRFDHEHEVKQIPENILGQLKTVLGDWRSRGFPRKCINFKRWIVQGTEQLNIMGRSSKEGQI